MTTRRVTTPSGERWAVRRRWLPHKEGKGLRQRFKRHSKLDVADGLDLPLDAGDGVAGIVVAIVVIVALVLLLIAGWPLILLGIDLAWVLLVGTLGVLGRVVLRRPWRVEATSGGTRRNWFVSGYRAAGRRRDELARQFQHGQNPLGTDAGAMPH